MNLLGFALAILPVALSPGASFTLAMNNAVQQGMRGTGRIILGTLLGIYTHALLAGLGITRLIAAYPALMNAIKIIGTAYLIYLAIRLIRSGLNAQDLAFTSGNRSTGIKEAYLANVLNIKAIMLYLTVVPAFAGSGATPWSYLVLASIHVAIMTLWLLFAGQMLIRSAAKISTRKLKKVIDIGGGTLLLIFTIWPYLAG
ncbi:MAG: LysE family translocator [Ewingella americana]|jgi:threonine/homoserine/homoserine lactone efflux protein|uniref:LysE family translocator n=1 Tax=Ewingella americana TaxID=41202 RepID=UPI00242EEDCB|nr:LysE family translocator [Ewingella americana]MCI1678346.1 LysE family translocator [Ewingella americana]MCI1856017.1 LysE family translocator [Ewingella americana]MCI1862242.1 LysE family translocator [Ewingella americana]MCI2142805.1 LysE family translocator [Ewingella americana]MCI2162596.1 LysE family translocator [Ewingella americana]